MRRCVSLVCAISVFGLISILFIGRAVADEGMWLFNHPPVRLLKERYEFEATDAWLEHLQKSAVRLTTGGSGSFVSEDGLVMSNHHVGSDALQKFGDRDHNYVRDGFFARTPGEEKRCHDLELNVLMSIEDVTDRVNAAVKPDLDAADAFLVRRKVMSGIEKDSQDTTGLRSDVITLYQGGAYHLYRFKRYTDVRLVFAPEQQIAFFGGDPDNFEYPRFDLDCCFFRVYENDKPVKVPHHLVWSRAGAGEGELIFVPGHPGHTSRLLTVAELEYLRDHQFPSTLRLIYRKQALLTAWGARSEENARKVRKDLFSMQNARKAREGGLAGLLDPWVMESKKAAEAKLRESVAGDARFKEAVGAWDRIAAAEKVIESNALRHNLIESGQAFSSTLFGIARTLLRAGVERPKPNGDRLKEFRDSGRESLELKLFSTAPIYDDYEQITLADSLTWLAECLGGDEALVKRILAGKSPRRRAAELIQGTRVKDVVLRKRLYDEGLAAVDAVKDPMIELARLVDEEARVLRKTGEIQTEIKQQAHSQLAKVRFALESKSGYPDATSSLRLAFGVVKGYEDEGRVPFQTTLAGLYQRSDEHKGGAPFDLPESWARSKAKLNLATPLNFVSTADIIGGNSGSPVVNRNGDLVGLIFDGNLQSHVGNFCYTETQSRALAVHSSAIMEALRKVYDAGTLADELETGRRGRKP